MPAGRHRTMVAAYAVIVLALAGCSSFPEHEGRANLEELAEHLKNEVARMPDSGPAPSSIPGPSNLPGTIEAYATADDRATADYLIASVVSEGWMANNGLHFGACLRVTWRGEKREIEQLTCPSARILGAAIEKEPKILDRPATVEAVHKRPCDPPVAKINYARCGG